MKKKHLTTVLLMMLVAALSVGATLAYLTDKEAVTNTFTVGKVGIELDEAKVNEYGEKVNEDGEVDPDSNIRVKANSYKLIPGHEYVKDPTVTVKAGSENSYIRMIVTINKANELKDLFGSNFLPQNFVKGWDSEIWITTKEVKGDENANTLTYEYRYYQKVNTLPVNNTDPVDKTLEPLFTHINFPSTVTEGAKFEALKDLKINIVAHAIQADGFDGADAAWKAFDSQNANN